MKTVEMPKFKIKISTNFYQAARNHIFNHGSNETYSHDSFYTKEDAIEGLKEIALNKVGDDYLVYESEVDALAHLIENHCYEAKIDVKKWIEDHTRLIKYLAAKYEYSSPGIYLNFAMFDIRESCKPGCEFQFGSETFNYDGYNYEIAQIED